MKLSLWGCGMVLLVWSLAAASDEREGIALESTRVIYPASAKNGITFTVTNRTAYVYLLQSRVLPWVTQTSATVEQRNTQERETEQTVQSPLDNTENTVAAPFIVLPPLARFAPDEAMTLRIRLTKNDLPKDKESVFSLSLKAIPSQSQPSSEEDSGAKVALALQNNLKLFYRPEGIVVMSADERTEALQFSQQESQLTINNPTPYYATLGQVKIGEIPLDFGPQRMIAPFSNATYHHVKPQGKTVSWQLIDDDGQWTALQTRSLR